MSTASVSPAMASFPDPRTLDSILSPQVVILESTVAANIQAMISVVGNDAQRLRPHLKTHKSEHITRMQVDRGITAFKASTLGEVAMAATAGATSVLLAHQIVGAKVDALLELCRRYPECRLAAIVDCLDAASQLDLAARSNGITLDVYVDVDCGMHRTGIAMNEPLDRLIDPLRQLASLRFAGLHVYDGHLHQPELALRQQCVSVIRDELESVLAKHAVETVVVGGTPTFGAWVQATQSLESTTRWQFSPGTSTLWDWGYGDSYPELPFQIAAAVLTRVISKPMGRSSDRTQRVCFDLGYKAIAAEMPLAERVRIAGLPEAEIVGHSEEHLVVAVDADRVITVGDSYWAFPKHICPTVANYAHAVLLSGSTNNAIPISPRT